MDGWIGKNEVEIGSDEEGLYFEAGSQEAAYGFIRLLAMGSAVAIAYVETHVISYEEVEMSEIEKTIARNRTEFIEMITDLIESFNQKKVTTRDPEPVKEASMLAVHIADGLEEAADRRSLRDIAISSEEELLVCPECGASQEDIMSYTAHEDIETKCVLCGYMGSSSDFRTATTGDGGKE